MENYISAVYERTHLKEGPLCIERFLTHLYLYGSASTKDLAQKLLIPVPVATAIKKELMACGLVVQCGGIVLSPLGQKYLEDTLGYKGVSKDQLARLLEDDDFAEETACALAEKHADLYENRPTVDVTIDQAKGTPETAFRRAILCLRREFLIGKKILCVGDDDLVSIALALLLKHIGSTGAGSEICVFDVDERFLSYIESTADTMQLPITCVKVDLKDPLPIRYANYFDVFFTDPPYTPGGISLFLSRGISAIKKTVGSDIYFSFGNKPIADTLAMQKMFSDMGLIVAEMLRDFNEYEGASLYGGVSQMLILQTTDDTAPLIEDAYEDDLYTYDFRNAQHTYICRACRQAILLEKGQTIEALKEAGCPSCGGKIFDQKGHAHKDIRIDTKKSLGTHILVDFFDCDCALLNDVDFIRRAMYEAAEVAKASIVADNFHHFSPYGVSGAIIIQESHFTIHTWPEHGYAAVDLFTCGDNLDLKNAMLTLKDRFGSRRLEFNNILRGEIKKGKVTPKT